MRKFIHQLSKTLSKRRIYHKINKRFIETKKSKIFIPTPDKDIAYLLGVVRGDGSLSQSKRKKGGYHYTFRIYSGNKESLNYLNSLFQNLFLIEGKILKDKRKESSYNLIIKNSVIFFYFAILGSEIGKKKHGKIPKIVKESNKNLANYLAGLVDTDGSISNKRIKLKQKSKELLKNI